MQSRVKLQSQSSVGKTVLLLGYGYVAQHLSRKLQALGHSITATYRTNKPDNNKIKWVEFGSKQMQIAFQTADIILSSIPPRDNQDPCLDALKTAKCRAEWVGYLSATSVYGDREGRWAFEAEAPTPSLNRGRARADAELAWIETGWPVHIFRLAGIYGPGRSPFEKIRKGEARAVIKEGHVVNRIHVDDIVTALQASMSKPHPLRIYNLADGHPAPPQDVLDYAAKLINKPAPKRVNVDSDDISDMARSFYSETKRIDASRAHKELGWDLKYRDYKSGLSAILKAETSGEYNP